MAYYLYFVLWEHDSDLVNVFPLDHTLFDFRGA